MKKLVSVLLCLALVLGMGSSALAASFDYTKLSGLDGYSYDKFTKSWMYQKNYTETYSDAYVVVGFSVNGDSEGLSNYPMLYTKIIDRSGKALYMINKIYFLIGDNLYSFDNLLEGGDLTGAFMGTIGKVMLEDMATATELSFKIVFNYKELSIDISHNDFSDTLKPFAQTIINNDIFGLCDETQLAAYDLFFDATIE